MGSFIITGITDVELGKLDHTRVAEEVDGKLIDCGQVRFGVGRELRGAPEGLRTVQLATGVNTVG